MSISKDDYTALKHFYSVAEYAFSGKYYLPYFKTQGLMKKKCHLPHQAY